MRDHYIDIFRSEADKGYIASIPDLKTCPALGETAAEALAHVEAAKPAWLEAACVEGESIPRPKCRPAIYQAAP